MTRSPAIAAALALAVVALAGAPRVGAAPPTDAIGAAGTGGGSGSSALRREGDALPVASRIVVHKSARRLELLRGEQVLRAYRVALGLNPVGHKERAGDFRTPEGVYSLIKRNPRSDFFLSMQVSYPAAQDLSRARRNGWDPGGSIMIHGLPNEPKKTAEYYATQDWTDGCIAVSNSDMVEIWMLVPDGTPIEIRP
jgi:murein L,D-transpeptidase YafK